MCVEVARFKVHKEVTHIADTSMEKMFITKNKQHVFRLR